MIRSTKTPYTPWQQKVTLVLCGIAIAFILLEIGLRIGAAVFFLAQEIRNKDLSKSDNTYTILCIGESMTALGGKYSYPSQLENILNRDYPHRRFKVINKGIPAKTSGDILLDLPQALTKYHPDMVVAMIGINDVIYDIFVPSSTFAKIKFLTLERLRVYKLIRTLKARLKTKIEEIKTPEAVAKDVDIEINAEETEDETLPELASEVDPQKSQAAAIKPFLYAYVSVDDKVNFKQWQKRILLDEYHPLTVRNLNDLTEMVLGRGIALTFVQYPLRKVDALKRSIDLRDRVLFIENDEIFRKALQKGLYEYYFEDRFAGDFGHCTPHGNFLLAQHIAGAIVEHPELSVANEASNNDK